MYWKTCWSASTPLETSPARTRLKDDIRETRRSYTRLLKDLLFDTIVKMCFGEARHAHDRCGIIIPEISPAMDRNAMCAFAEQFDPKTSLPKLRDLFLECWMPPYGGSAWAIIAEAAMKYWSEPQEIFVDHCVDLSHHGGLAFDKLETGFHVWHKRKYLDILDCKRNGSLLAIDMILPVFHFVETLLVRAHNLKLIDSIPELKISGQSHYRPVQWGNRILSDALCPDTQKSPEVFKEKELEGGVYERR